MHWQTAITWLAISVACLYLARRFVNSIRTAKTGCAGGCGCAKPKVEAPLPALIPPESLTFRRR